VDEAEEILAAARRGADLVGRLLRVASEPKVELRPTDLARMVRDMRGMFRAILLDSVSLEVRVGGGPISHVSIPISCRMRC
jgi:hypothetical protein